MLTYARKSCYNLTEVCEMQYFYAQAQAFPFRKNFKKTLAIFPNAFIIKSEINKRRCL